MTKGNAYRPTKHERNFLKGAMFKCDQREEVLASVAIDCINASTEANAEVTAVASGNAFSAVMSSQTMVAIAHCAMSATRPRLQSESYEATTSKSSGPPPSQPVPKQLPWNAHHHQESAVCWRAPQAGVWQGGVWQKHRDVWEAPQEAAWRKQKEKTWWEPPPSQPVAKQLPWNAQKQKEKTWWEPPPVPRQDPGSVPQWCSVRRDGETSPPGTPPAKRPPARKALEKIEEATSADDGTACTDDPYMVAGAGPAHAEGNKRRRLTELASTSTRS